MRSFAAICGDGRAIGPFRTESDALVFCDYNMGLSDSSFEVYELVQPAPVGGTGPAASPRRLPLPSYLAGRALARLITGERLTHRSFDRVSRTYRLAAHIETLRNNLGWPIADEWQICRTGDAGRIARFKIYFLPPDVIESITDGEREWALSVLRKERERQQATGNRD